MLIVTLLDKTGTLWVNDYDFSGSYTCGTYRVESVSVLQVGGLKFMIEPWKIPSPMLLFRSDMDRFPYKDNL